MQILPNEMDMTGVNSLFNTSTTSAPSDVFSEHLKLAQKSIQNDKNNDLFISEPLDEAPYSSNNVSDSGFYSLSEVGFTKPELFQLHQELVKAGASTDDLAKLRQLLEKPDGASISQVLESLTPQNEPVLLSKEEQSALSAILSKIDSSGALENNIAPLLESGQGLEALSVITKQLIAMDPNLNIDISKDELAVIGKALGISETGQARLLSSFGSFTSLELNSSEVKSLLSPAFSDLTERDSSHDKLQKALETTLGPILQKAKDRFQAEQDAISLLNKGVQHSNTLIKETVTEEAKKNIGQAVTGEKSNASSQSNADKNAQGKVNEDFQGVSSEDAQNSKNQNGQPLANENIKNKNGQGLVADENNKNQNGQGPVNENAKNTKPENPLLVGQIAENSNKETMATGKTDAANENIVADKNMQNGTADRNTANDNNSPNNKDSKDSNWDSLLGKVEVQQTATKSDTSFSSVVGAQNANNPISPENDIKNMQKSTPTSRYMDQNIANQVENGLLTAMKNGTKKLELQLNPGDLGTITLILTSARNGEISASIRSDRTETAEVMQRQLDVIRVNLEQQGIKVDKLEVQYEAHEKQNEGPWKDLQEHNNQQEKHARQEQLERLRNLKAVRNSGKDEQNGTLEQNMHISNISENSSATGLHLVA